MAYTQDIPNAARRHLKAAQTLFETQDAGAQPGCKAVAGYLFGLSGELAVKQLMRKSGMKPRIPEDRRNDPFYAHFPELKTQLRDAAVGHHAAKLSNIAVDASLFQNWDTDMRYSATADIRENWIASWKASAERLVAEMDIA